MKVKSIEMKHVKITMTKHKELYNIARLVGNNTSTFMTAPDFDTANDIFDYFVDYQMGNDL